MPCFGRRRKRKRRRASKKEAAVSRSNGGTGYEIDGAALAEQVEMEFVGFDRPRFRTLGRIVEETPDEMANTKQIPLSPAGSQFGLADLDAGGAAPPAATSTPATTPAPVPAAASNGNGNGNGKHSGQNGHPVRAADGDGQPTVDDEGFSILPENRHEVSRFPADAADESSSDSDSDDEGPRAWQSLKIKPKEEAVSEDALSAASAISSQVRNMSVKIGGGSGVSMASRMGQSGSADDAWGALPPSAASPPRQAGFEEAWEAPPSSSAEPTMLPVPPQTAGAERLAKPLKKLLRDWGIRLWLPPYCSRLGEPGISDVFVGEVATGLQKGPAGHTDVRQALEFMRVKTFNRMLKRLGQTAAAAATAESGNGQGLGAPLSGFGAGDSGSGGGDPFAPQPSSPDRSGGGADLMSRAMRLGGGSASEITVQRLPDQGGHTAEAVAAHDTLPGQIADGPDMEDEPELGFGAYGF